LPGTGQPGVVAEVAAVVVPGATRYSTLGFQDAANLDDGDIWPVAYALVEWTPVVEKKVAELVKAAISG
jgi:uncharacterized protein YdhG (YjbR/CyaY superfamily)